jgi:hypothetical protein
MGAIMTDDDGMTNAARKHGNYDDIANKEAQEDDEVDDDYDEEQVLIQRSGNIILVETKIQD